MIFLGKAVRALQSNAALRVRIKRLMNCAATKIKVRSYETIQS
jgi:hypothetical protein